VSKQHLEQGIVSLFFNCDLQRWIDLNMTMAMDEGENSVWMRFLAITCYSVVLEE